MKEQLSALIDNELDAHDSAAVLSRLAADPDLRGDWQEWHLVGDAMQSHPLLSPDFMKRFSERLAAEPIVLVPKKRRSLLKRALVPLSAAASVAFVSVVGWQAYYGAYRANSQAAPAAATMASAEGDFDVVRMQDYVAAHRHDSVGTFEGREFMQASYDTAPQSH
ncbi:sigma-E factor negative regulatory protein [Chitinolyticbacter meiyuanensis]|uniref:sigma-E factor negative regulatory protein n=1 Tax=Chitinolyticbacter meiyuanensis TaxID=682798 RepID=UPI0011E5EB5D|nr:sigma-E factor negative regulatory protein [Chitinolyticbacter meiyuanensis]